MRWRVYTRRADEFRFALSNRTAWAAAYFETSRTAFFVRRQVELRFRSRDLV